MRIDSRIPEPFQFNPLKHHLSFIREFIADKLSEENRLDVRALVKEVRHIGSSVMDIYTGELSVHEICNEIKEYLKKNHLDKKNSFSGWSGIKYSDFRTTTISDKSSWMLKYHNDDKRFVHLFPSRFSPHSFRVKANTLKSAILYYIIIGKDFVSREDLNNARSLLGLSPVKDPEEARSITELIETIRFI
ncbi:MAG: hypothetical protein MUF36_11750 [Bacteroidales bacterium]|jgi:hypothetical protein|nr:hypothetical protein [Bacteroidales bacterium]